MADQGPEDEETGSWSKWGRHDYLPSSPQPWVSGISRGTDAVPVGQHMLSKVSGDWVLASQDREVAPLYIGKRQVLTVEAGTMEIHQKSYGTGGGR